MEYNFREGKERVNRILNDENNIEQKEKVPEGNKFNYHNGYYSNVTALFVDIKDSTKLFSQNKRKATSKIIRAFTSEIIEILKSNSNLREIGIRGDCVYGIYTCFTPKENYQIAEKAFYINTYIKMLNKLLSNKGMRNIVVGIGVAKDKELVVKAGSEESGIHNLVWIGKAVTHASKFSGIANREVKKPIIFSNTFFNSIITKLKRNADSNDLSSWFESHDDNNLGSYYSCDVTMVEFKKWIDGGMK